MELPALMEVTNTAVSADKVPPVHNAKRRLTNAIPIPAKMEAVASMASTGISANATSDTPAITARRLLVRPIRVRMVDFARTA